MCYDGTVQKCIQQLAAIMGGFFVANEGPKGKQIALSCFSSGPLAFLAQIIEGGFAL